MGGMDLLLPRPVPPGLAFQLSQRRRVRPCRLLAAGRCLALVASLVAALSSEVFAADHVFHFDASGNFLDADATRLAAAVAADLRTDVDAHVVICAHTGGLEPSWEPAIRAQARALEVFFALVHGGVAPERIQLGSTPPTPPPAHVDVVTHVRPGTPSLRPYCQSGPSSYADAAAPLVIQFAVGSAEPEVLACSSLAALAHANLQGEGIHWQVEGYTDATGRARYNEALGRLRQLRVAEALVRAGLPAQHLTLADTPPRPKAPTARAGERVVVVRSMNGAAGAAKVAGSAPIASTSQTPTPDAPRTKKEPVSSASDAPPPARATGRSADLGQAQHLDVVPLVGFVAPLGELRHHAKPAFLYGLGIGRALVTTRPLDLQLTLFASGTTSLNAKEPALDAFLQLFLLELRADAVFNTGRVRPYVGGSASFVAWRQRVRRRADGETHRATGHDPGVAAALGAQI